MSESATLSGYFSSMPLVLAWLAVPFLKIIQSFDKLTEKDKIQENKAGYFVQ